MKKTVRILSFVLSVICFVLNIGPVIISNQINIGVITGMAASLVFLLYGIMFEKINSAISKLWKKTFGKVMIIIVCLCLTAVAITGGYIFGNILAYSTPSERPTEYAIVLGCKVNGTQPGIFLERRLRKAIEYLEKNPTCKAILSGGKGSDEDISEAQCMYNYLVEKGISTDRLIVEDSSTSTIENFRNSLEILDSQGIEIKEITVVTNDFHEYRASKFAEECGLNAHPYPAPTSWNGYIPFTVREIYAIIYQIYLK